MTRADEGTVTVDRKRCPTARASYSVLSAICVMVRPRLSFVLFGLRVKISAKGQGEKRLTQARRVDHSVIHVCLRRERKMD